jgi:hypothetical protein
LLELDYIPAEGTVLNAGVHPLSVTAAATTNYNSATAPVSINVAKAPVTASFTANDKPFDGNNTATIKDRSLIGTIPGDDVSLAGGTATFADKNVGVGPKTVTATGFSLSGAAARIE